MKMFFFFHISQDTYNMGSYDLTHVLSMNKHVIKTYMEQPTNKISSVQQHQNEITSQALE